MADSTKPVPNHSRHVPQRFFGHLGHRSEWQLIKIDYKGIFSRRCMDGDYQTWHLHNKAEPCVMGEKQVYMKRRPGNRCMLTQDYSRIYSSEPCPCRAYDFECPDSISFIGDPWLLEVPLACRASRVDDERPGVGEVVFGTDKLDYGFDRQADGMCSPAFWFNPNTTARTCSTSHSFMNSTGYRKVLSNNCKEGGRNVFSPRRQACQPSAPLGLRLSTSQGELAVPVGTNVTFLVHLDQTDFTTYRRRLYHLKKGTVLLSLFEGGTAPLTWSRCTRKVTLVPTGTASSPWLVDRRRPSPCGGVGVKPEGRRAHPVRLAVEAVVAAETRPGSTDAQNQRYRSHCGGSRVRGGNEAPQFVGSKHNLSDAGPFVVNTRRSARQRNLEKPRIPDEGDGVWTGEDTLEKRSSGRRLTSWRGLESFGEAIEKVNERLWTRTMQRPNAGEGEGGEMTQEMMLEEHFKDLLPHHRAMSWTRSCLAPGHRREF
ncbi:hypothetical protein CRUP_025968 [Coryphaenoides rupestris]|nr:hypothetical protein CRUP_025968 [Coryphaenoides rupestris]